MGCLKGKKKCPEDKAKYICKKCGGISDSKKDICRPQKKKCKNCDTPCCRKEKPKKDKKSKKKDK